MTTSVGGAENSNFPLARCGGEHLGCNPCGKVAGCEQGHRLAGPGGVAVALAETSVDYTNAKKRSAYIGPLAIRRCYQLFKLEAAGLEGAVALQGGGVCGGGFDGLGFLHFQPVNQQSVE